MYNLHHVFKPDSMSVNDILAVHPKPWVEGRADTVGLNKTGWNALSLILLSHSDCVDCEMAMQHQGSKELFMQDMAAGAKRFREQHKGRSCVPGLPAIALELLMGLFEMDCLYKAGVLDQNGERVCHG